MHPSSLLRVRWFVEHQLADVHSRTRVLDAGSFDANGADRPMFGSRFAYAGLGIEPESNVDIAEAKPSWASWSR
jgi:hypothetical protein